MKVRIVKDHFCGTEWRAEPETLYLGGVGAVYVENLEFELPVAWADMAVTLHIEQEGGTVPQPMLLDGNNTVPVDGRFTTARQGLWMLMATDGEGRTLLARRHGITGQKWNTTWCTYADSLMDVYLNSEYLKDAQQAQKMAEGEMQGTSLTGAEKKLLAQILQLAANKNSEMQPAVDELKALWNAK